MRSMEVPERSIFEKKGQKSLWENPGNRVLENSGNGGHFRDLWTSGIGSGSSEVRRDDEWSDPDHLFSECRTPEDSWIIRWSSVIKLRGCFLFFYN